MVVQDICLTVGTYILLGNEYTPRDGKVQHDILACIQRLWDMPIVSKNEGHHQIARDEQAEYIPCSLLIFIRSALTKVESVLRMA